MDNQNINILIVGFVIIFFGWRFFKFKKIKAQIPDLIAQGATIVDVRSATEFQAAANPLSINIPLDSIGSQLKKINPEKPVILCCASGARSGVAVGILKANGFTQVVNAGPWTNTL